MIDKDNFVAEIEDIVKECSFDGCNTAKAERLAESLYKEVTEGVAMFNEYVVIEIVANCFATFDAKTIADKKNYAKKLMDKII